MTEEVATAGQQKNNATKASHKKKKRGRLMVCMKAPLKAFQCTCDMYVKSLGGCARAGGGGGRGAPMTGVTAGMVAMMPRARSVNAFGNSNGFGGSGRDDDFKELLHTNSKQDHDDAATCMAQAIKRSQSVALAIGRIDEDAPCNDFAGDINKLEILRSKSCVVVPTTRRINALGVTPTT